MKKIKANKNYKKVINFIKDTFPNVSESAIYKALRQKDIRINDVKINQNLPVHIGDEVTIYITDELLFGNFAKLNPKIIVFEDHNIIVINKPKGILVQGNDLEIGLDKLLNDYYGTYCIVPCHRLDRNTSGLVIFAKDTESEEILLDIIKRHEITKHYKCLVYGHPKQGTATLHAFLFKDRKTNRVIISDEKKKGYVEIITKYSVIEKYKDETALLDVELVTGRTHQIRAHLAYIGHPIIGDGKYGINSINKSFGKTWQELESYKICFKNAHGKLKYLKGKEISIG